MKLKLTAKSLRLRVLLMVALILLGVITASTAALTYGFTRLYTNALLSKSFTLGESVRDGLADAMSLGLTLDTLSGVNEKCMEVTRRHPEIGYCIVTDTAGKVLFSADGTMVGTQMKDPVSAAAAKSSKPLAQVFAHRQKKYYDTAVPLSDAESRHVGALRLGMSHDEIGARKKELIFKSAIVAAVSLAVAVAVFMFFIVRFITTPITSLVVAATQIARGDLTKTIEYDSGDELGELAGAINRMVSNIKGMIARVKDASISVANATERIAMNSKKISEGAQAQHELTENTSS